MRKFINYRNFRDQHLIMSAADPTGVFKVVYDCESNDKTEKIDDFGASNNIFS